jgi:Restriction endonuclease
MNVFDHPPADWQALQNLTGQLFAEIGCRVEIGKTIANVRGAKEVDVCVHDNASVPSALYLCECKHWQRAVPQEVVHSFRTVLLDTGAHRGFIISSSSFQKGAYEAAQNTNIDLVSFEALQAIFFDRWREAMAERFMPYADRLFPYWDYPGRMPRFRWKQAHVARQHQLMEAYQPLLHLGPLARMQGFRFQLPMILPAVDERGAISGEVRIETYRQLYNFIDASKDLALYHFQVLHGEVAPNRTPGEYDPLA